MSITDLALGLRRLLRNDERDALRKLTHAEAEARAAYAREYDESAMAMRALDRSGTLAVFLGQSLDSEGKPYPVLFRHEDAIAGGHMLLSGASGGGKTALAIIMLAQLLARDPRRTTQIIIEPKRDLAPFVRDVLVPCLTARLPEDDAMALAERFVSLNVFDEASTLPFQVLTRDPTLTVNEQAFEVTTSFSRTVGLRDIGPLQETTLRLAFAIGIDTGLNVEQVAQLLRDEAYRRSVLTRATHIEARDYFLERFARERPSGLAALLNRLDALLSVPGLRRLLGSPGMVRLPDLLNGYVTVIDLGGAPAGMREAQRFIGELIVARLVRAIFSRRITRDTLPVGLWLDEFQELLTPELAADAERVLAMARAQRCFLRILHQSGAQFTDHNFLRIVRSLSNFHAVFRSDEQDARYLESFLPVIREEPEPGETVQMSETAERAARRALLETIPRLPDRSFIWWDKRQSHPAILARTMTYPFNETRRVAMSLPLEFRRILHTGAIEQVTERREEFAQTDVAVPGAREDERPRPQVVQNDVADVLECGLQRPPRVPRTRRIRLG